MFLRSLLSVILGIYPEAELLGHMVMLFIFVAFSLLSVIYCFFISRFYLIILVKNYLVYKENISEARPIIVRPLAGEKEDYEPLFVDSSKDISLINKKEEE